MSGIDNVKLSEFYALAQMIEAKFPTLRVLRLNDDGTPQHRRNYRLPSAGVDDLVMYVERASGMNASYYAACLYGGDPKNPWDDRLAAVALGRTRTLVSLALKDLRVQRRYSNDGVTALYFSLDDERAEAFAKTKVEARAEARRAALAKAHAEVGEVIEGGMDNK